MARANGQITILDLNDAILSGTAPKNPVNGTLWIDSSVTPNILKKWNGVTWVTQQLEIGSLDPGFHQEVEDLKTFVTKASDDGFITSAEKLNVKMILVQITGDTLAGTALPTLATIDTAKGGEVYLVRAEAYAAGISKTSTAYTEYETAYNSLKTYLDGLTPRPWQSGDTPVVDATWTSQWDIYYEKMARLRVMTSEYLANAIKPGADYNGVTMTTQNGIVVLRGDNLVRTTMNATDGLTIEKNTNGVWSKVFYADATGKITATGLAIDASSTINGTTASTVVTRATAGNTLATDFASDLKMVAGEKIRLKKEWEAVQSEYTSLSAEADSVGVDKTLYVAAYNALNSTTPRVQTDILASMTSTYTFTTTTRDAFNNQWRSYYSEAERLRKGISEKLKEIGDRAQSSAEFAEWYTSAKASGNLVKSSHLTNSSAGYEWVDAITPDGTIGKVLSKKHLAGSGTNNNGFFVQNIKVDPKKTYLLEFWVKAMDTNSRYYLGREEYDASGNDNDQGNGPYAAPGLNANVADVGKWVKVTGLMTPHFAGEDNSSSTEQSLFTSGYDYKFYNASTAQVRIKTYLTYSATTSLDSEMQAYGIGLYEVGSTDGLYGEIDNAQKAADQALTAIADMSSDGKITPVEKVQLKKEWGTISSEKTTHEALATTYGITTEKTNFTNAYNSLNTTLNGASGILSDMQGTSTVVATTFRAQFDDYYNKKALLNKKINETARTLANNAQTKANAADTTANTLRDTTVPALTTRVSNAETTLSVLPGQIQSKVSQTEFESLTIGTRNIIFNGNFINGTEHWTNPNANFDIVDDSRFGKIARIQALSSRGGLLQGRTYSEQAIVDGEEYVWSLWLKSDTPTRIDVGIDGGGATNAASFNVTTEWTKFSSTRISSDGNNIFRIYSTESSGAGYFYVANVKVEKGNRASDFTPAPEDIENKMALIDSRLGTAESSITQTSKDIQLKVNATDVYTIAETNSELNKKANQTALNTTNQNVTAAVEEAKKALRASVHVLNSSPAIGAAYHTGYGHAIKVEEDIHMGRCQVNAQTAGSMSVSLRKRSNGEVLETKTYTLTAGLNTLSLDMFLSKEVGEYALMAVDSVPLHRQTSGAPVNNGSFTVLGGVSGSGTGTPNSGYYYFYNIEIAGMGVDGQVVDSKLKADVVTAKQTADSGVSKADAAQTTATTANSTANTLKNTTVPALTTRVSNAESAITQTSNDIALRVTKEQFDSLSIGGRNLLLNTKLGNSGEKWDLSANASITDEQTINGNFSAKIETVGSTTNVYRNITQKDIDLKIFQVGETYTYSFWVMSPEVSLIDATEVGLVMYITGKPTIWNSTSFLSKMENNKWLKVEQSFVFDPETTRVDFRMNLVKNGTIYYSSPKVEKGHKATDWSPSPIDVDSNIASAVTTAKGEIKITTDAITSSVSGLTSTVNNHTTTINTHDSSINTLKDEILLKASKEEMINRTLGVRYIKVTSAGSTANAGNHLVELEAFNAAGTNLALGKLTMLSSASLTTSARLTDGNKSTSSYHNFGEGNGWIQLDLEAIHTDVEFLNVWFYYADGRTYKDTLIEVSEDGVTWTALHKGNLKTDSGKGFIVKVNDNLTVDRINSAQAQLSVQAGQISSKVESTDYTGEKMFSKLNQTSSAFKLEAKNIDIDGKVTFSSLDPSAQSKINAIETSAGTANNKIDNLQIGGRNLARRLGGGIYDPNSIYGSDENLVKEVVADGEKWLEVIGTGSFRLTSIPIEPNTEYTWSFDAYNTSAIDYITVNNYYSGATPSYPGSGVSIPTKKARVSATFRSATNATYEIVHINGLAIGTRLANFKLEKGNRASDWTPAPEDVDGTISEVKGTADSAKKDITDNKTVWDRATNINSNGTFNTTKLSGTVTDAQVANSSKWNTSSADTARWKMTGKTTIDGGNIETDTITAAQIKAGSITVGLMDDTTKGELSKVNISNYGNYKVFKSPIGYSHTSSSVSGYCIIETPIVSSYMSKVRIKGYNYSDGKTSIDLNVDFYAHGSGFARTGFTSFGDFVIDKVQVARDANGKAIIILGQSNTVWNYPKIYVESAELGYGTPPDSYQSGWGITFTNTLPTTSYLQNVSGRELNSTYNSVETWRMPNKTTINGGNIETNTIKAAQINAGEITTEHIATVGIDAKVIKAGTIDAGRIRIGPSTAFESGYNPADKVDPSQMGTAIDEAKSKDYGYRYKTSIVLNGEHNKYYPVLVAAGGDQNVKRDILIKRSYSEQHPAEWNSATHGGGLTLKIKTNFGGWGGANYSWEVHELEEMYNPTFGGAQNTTHQMSFSVFLRGGGTTGAIYHIYSDQPISGTHSYAGVFPKAYYSSSELMMTHSNTAYNYYAPEPKSTPDTAEIEKRNFVKLSQASDSRLKAWQYSNTTYIDGGNIYTGSVTADQIKADTITSREIKGGSLTIGNVDANLKGILSNAEVNLINPNPFFVDWTGSYPVGFASMAGSGLQKAISMNGVGNSVKYVVGSGANTYLTGSQVTSSSYTQYVTCEVTFMLQSGGIDGAGVLIRYEASSDIDQRLRIKDIINSPVLGKWYTVTKTFKTNSATPVAGFTGYSIFLMGGWTSLGAIDAKTIQFDALKVRPSSEQEINAYESGETISSWRYPGKTTINGGNIETNSIKAAQINAGEITTDHITATGLNASVIKAGVIDAARIKIGSGTSYDDGYDPTKKTSKVDISFAGLDNSTDWIILLCAVGSGYSNFATGRLYGRRVSGHVNSAVIDVVVNNNTSGVPSAAFRSVGVQSADQYEMVRCTYAGVEYIGLRYSGGQAFQVWTQKATFDGDHASTGAHWLNAVDTSTCTGVAKLSNQYVASEQSSGPISWPGGSTGETNKAVVRVGDWEYGSDKTYINGGKIFTGTVTADQIAANTIEAKNLSAGSVTASKLKVSSSNMLWNIDTFAQYKEGVNPDGSQGSSTNSIVSEVDSPIGKNVLKHISTGTSSYKYLDAEVNTSTGWARLSPGKKYILSAYVKTTSTAATSVQMITLPREYRSSTLAGTSTAVTQSIKASDGWVRISTAINTVTGTNPALAFYVRHVSSGITSYWTGFMLEENTGTDESPSPFVSGGSVRMEGGNLTANSVTATQIAAGSITATNGIITSIDASKITTNTMHGDRITAGTINTGHINTTGLDAQHIKFGTMDGDRITAGSIKTGHIETAGLSAGVIKTGSMHGDRITAGTLSADRIDAVGLNASIIKSGYIDAARIKAGTITSDMVSTNGLDAKHINTGTMQGASINLGGVNNTNGTLEVFSTAGEPIAELNGDFGGFPRLYVDYLDAPNKVEYGNFSDQPLKLYVNGSATSYGTPSDENAGTSLGTSLATLGEALRRVPNQFDGEVTIMIHHGETLYEDVNISGFSGGGLMKIINSSTSTRPTVNGSLNIVNNSVRLEWRDININTTNDYAGVFVQNTCGLMADVSINGANGTSNVTSNAVNVNAGGYFEFYRVNTSNVRVGFRASYGGFAYVSSCTGRGDLYGLQAFGGGIIAGTGTAPQGASSNTQTTQGGQVSGSWSYPTPPAAPSYTKETVVTKWTSNSDSGSYRTDYGAWDTYGSANQVTQGSYSGHGRFYGSWFFGTSVNSAVSGKTIQRIRVYIKRDAGGSSASQNVTITTHSNSSRPSGNSSFSSTSYNSGFKVGEGKWVTLPSSFHTAFRSGGARGFGITGSSPYMKFSKNATIEVTYEK